MEDLNIMIGGIIDDIYCKQTTVLNNNITIKTTNK